MQFGTFVPKGMKGLDSHGFCAFLHSLQIRLTRSSVENIFQVIDTDLDGLVFIRLFAYDLQGASGMGADSEGLDVTRLQSILNNEIVTRYYDVDV
jgi:hypothetical protein